MPISDYYRKLREKVGTDLLLLPSVAAVIRNDKSEILFQYPRNSDDWSFPAGAIEPGESPAEAVVREVREETGLEVEPINIIGVFGGKEFRHTYANGDRVEYQVTVYECKIISGTLEAMDGESEILKYFKEENIPKLALPYPEWVFKKRSERHA
ncbi:MAG: NUDIX domain-containing protein [Bacillota bacterium]|uniref:NUDIX domain-containing protein n=1 Tax=Bacillus sp. RO2 TaxID=2723913 RepID=UPI00145F5AD9|nr:NUDIX domain-containing protein [Bacillus sp. RO2]MEA3319660.1 NUDIX domain-containing protein [Bacillota bacterium]NMH71669.1 NUDIX domain-containing protein [Bacillus sp. RO2]